MRIAPLITFLRVIALPLIIFLTLQETALGATIAVGVMILAILSDLADGVVAKREKKLISFFDPFADKVLILGLLITFVVLDKYWLLALVAFISRDIIVAIIRLLAGREDFHLSGGLFGKVMTGAQYVVILAILLQDSLDLREQLSLTSSNLLAIMVTFFTIVALIIALLSIIHYLVLFRKKIQNRAAKEQKLKKEEIIVLANKRSRGFYNRYRRRLLRIFSRRRGAKIVYLPRNEDMFVGSEDKLGKAEHVVVAGGDGSFESALNYKPLHSKTLGFFPFGAGNAYYSYFYKGKRFEYLRKRFHFYEENVDVFEVKWDKGVRQTTFIGIGIDATVIEQSSIRTKHGFLDYMKGSIKAAFKRKSGYALRVRIDGEEHNWPCAFNVIIAKIPYLGFGIRSFPKKIIPNDGKVYCLAGLNIHLAFFNKILRVWSLLLAIFGLEKSPLFLHKGKKMVFESSEQFPLHAGGEFLGYTKKMSVRVVRKQKVLMI